MNQNQLLVRQPNINQDGLFLNVFCCTYPLRRPIFRPLHALRAHLYPSLPLQKSFVVRTRTTNYLTTLPTMMAAVYHCKFGF